MRDPLLELDETMHVYRYNGVIVPGVTSLLGLLHSFANVPPEVLEIAKERGTDVHAMTHMEDESDLDEPRLKAECPSIWAYLPSYRQFKRDCTPKWRSIEEPIFHRVLRYATTPDRLGEFTYKGKRLTDTVLEIKTSATSHPVWGLQTMAQAQAAGRPSARRFSLQIFPEGSPTPYKLREWTKPSDWSAFVSLITLRTWKEENGL